MKLSNIDSLDYVMGHDNLSKVTFTAFILEKEFKCLYINDIIPKRLFITAIGSNPFVLDVPITDENQVSDSLARVDYKKLSYYIYPRFTSSPFYPRDFFTALDKVLSTVEITKAKTEETLKFISKIVDVEESDKIYFKSFYKNTSPNKPTDMNRSKTAFAFGKEFSELLYRQSISTVWSVTPTDKSSETDHIAELLQNYHNDRK